MAISQVVHVSTSVKTIAPVIYAVQGDTGRQIVAEYEDFFLSASMTGVFAFERSDGTNYSVPVTIDVENNSATAEMDQALTQPGRTNGQIKITDSSGLGSTFAFYIDVQEDLSGTPTEQEYYDIQVAIEAAAEAKAEADQVLEDLGPISQINDRLTDAEEELDNKADIDGTYPSLTAGLAEQLLSSNRVIDQTPYLYRQTALGKANATRALMKKIVGGSVVWNQLCNGSSVTVPSGHKYAAKIGGSWSISASTGTAITGLTAGTDMVTDLTALFGSATIADYIYSIEQATAGSGIAKLKEWGFFGEDYYEYDAGTMRIVEGVSAKVTRDAEQNVIGNYQIDSLLTLRGIPKLDSDNNLYYDGDEYAADGMVTRRHHSYTFTGSESFTRISTRTEGWNIFAWNPNPAPINRSNVIDCISDFAQTVLYSSIDTSAITQQMVSHYGTGIRFIMQASSVANARTALTGKTIVYELATPTTETAEPYTEVQVVDTDGTEEFVTTGIVPVGHVTEYPEDLVGKLDSIPNPPTAAGRYVLQATVASGKVTYAWAAE